MDVEKKLVNDLRRHEQVIQIISYEELLKESDSIKSVAKTLSGLASPAKDLNTARRLLGDFGFNAKQVVIKVYNNKKYIIFKGHPGARNIFKGTRYLASNPKVLRFAIGPKGIITSVKTGFVLTVVLSVGIEVFDYFINDRATLSQLLGNVSSDLLKIGISSITAAVAGLTFGSMAAVTP